MQLRSCSFLLNRWGTSCLVLGQVPALVCIFAQTSPPLVHHMARMMIIYLIRCLTCRWTIKGWDEQKRLPKHTGICLLMYVLEDFYILYFNFFNRQMPFAKNLKYKFEKRLPKQILSALQQQICMLSTRPSINQAQQPLQALANYDDHHHHRHRHHHHHRHYQPSSTIMIVIIIINHYHQYPSTTLNKQWKYSPIMVIIISIITININHHHQSLICHHHHLHQPPSSSISSSLSIDQAKQPLQALANYHDYKLSIITSTMNTLLTLDISNPKW